MNKNKPYKNKQQDNIPPTAPRAHQHRGLLHRVRREDDAAPALGPAHDLPERVARGGVEPGRGLWRGWEGRVSDAHQAGFITRHGRNCRHKTLKP